MDIGLGDGTSVITARSQGIPIRYVATIYADFPSVVVAERHRGITTAADLAGSASAPRVDTAAAGSCSRRCSRPRTSPPTT